MFGRKPPLKSVGTDPDYRFSLANERTFLAWLRTGLGLLAGAIALASLVHDFGPRPIRVGMTVLLLILALTVTVGSYVRWERIERALREQRQLPTSPMPRLIVFGVSVVIAAGATLIYLAQTGR